MKCKSNKEVKDKERERKGLQETGGPFIKWLRPYVQSVKVIKPIIVLLSRSFNTVSRTKNVGSSMSIPTVRHKRGVGESTDRRVWSRRVRRGTHVRERRWVPELLQWVIEPVIDGTDDDDEGHRRVFRKVSGVWDTVVIEGRIPIV